LSTRSFDLIENLKCSYHACDPNEFVDSSRTYNYTQIPAQSAPPFLGSQSSLGSSTHLKPPLHLNPANPPHITGFTHIPGASQAIPHPPLYGSSTQISSLGQLTGRTVCPPHEAYLGFGDSCGGNAVLMGRTATQTPAQFSPLVQAGSVWAQVWFGGQGAILKPHGRFVSAVSEEVGDWAVAVAVVVAVRADMRRKIAVVRCMIDIF